MEAPPGSQSNAGAVQPPGRSGPKRSLDSFHEDVPVAKSASPTLLPISLLSCELGPWCGRGAEWGDWACGSKPLGEAEKCRPGGSALRRLRRFPGATSWSWPALRCLLWRDAGAGQVTGFGPL